MRTLLQNGSCAHTLYGAEALLNSNVVSHSAASYASTSIAWTKSPATQFLPILADHNGHLLLVLLAGTVLTNTLSQANQHAVSGSWSQHTIILLRRSHLTTKDYFPNILWISFFWWSSDMSFESYGLWIIFLHDKERSILPISPRFGLAGIPPLLCYAR